MPAVLPPASKYLAQKWQEERFRVHRDRVRHAPSLLDMSAPRVFPHLKLQVNKLALEEERQAKYDRENQMLLKKIRFIVKGHGTCDNWNTYVKKDLHTQARLKQQRDIEWENLRMLKRIKGAKPVIQKKKQIKDFQKHKQHQELIQSTSKDYLSPRVTGGRAYSESGSLTDRSEKTVTREPSERSDSDIKEEEGEETATETEDKNEETDVEKEEESLPPLPEGKKRNTNKPPPENKKKNRNATVPKLPKI